MPTIFEAFVKFDFCLIILISSKLILLISSKLILLISSMLILISSELIHHHLSTLPRYLNVAPFPELQDLDSRFIHVTRKCWTSPNIKSFVSPSSFLSSLHLAWIIFPLGLLFYRPFTMSFCPYHSCHSALSYTRRDLWNHLHNEGRIMTGRGRGGVGCQFWGRIARTSISTWF